jgi:hypothetical protein
MSRSQTTGAYTRVDNSFSNPVIGTTISPTDADTFFDDVESAVNAFLGTSTTSLAIGTGAKTFTIASDVANKVFLANTHIHAFSLANTANYMDCTVTSYNNSTGALVTDCFAIGGSGTITDWVIISSGARGATGATGAQGPTSGLQQTYSTTTADADPGAGVFRLNNATPPAQRRPISTTSTRAALRYRRYLTSGTIAPTRSRARSSSRNQPTPLSGPCSTSRAQWLTGRAIAS